MLAWFKSRKLATDLDLASAVRDVLGRVERLEGQHLSLRGYIYAKKGLVGPAGAPPPAAEQGPLPQSPPQPLARDELRKLLVTTGRFFPGKPPKHQE